MPRAAVYNYENLDSSIVLCPDLRLKLKQIWKSDFLLSELASSHACISLFCRSLTRTTAINPSMGQMKPKQTGWGESSSLLPSLLGLCVPERGHQTLLVLCDRKTNQNDTTNSIKGLLVLFSICCVKNLSESMTGTKTRMCVEHGYFLEWEQMIKTKLIYLLLEMLTDLTTFFVFLTLCSNICKMLCINPRGSICSVCFFCPFLIDRHWKRCGFFLFFFFPFLGFTWNSCLWWLSLVVSALLCYEKRGVSCCSSQCRHHERACAPSAGPGTRESRTQTPVSTEPGVWQALVCWPQQ